MSLIQTIFDAVASVLREFGPQDADSLVSMMLDMKLWRAKGRNPAATLHRHLLQYIADHGPAARFRLLDTGQFDLNSPAPRASASRG
jgi:hypothetical protein